MKKKFGIMGNPIKHSLSPVLHKYWFEKYNIDADYVIIEALDKDLPDLIKKINQRNYSGFNVTLPFKQKIINYLDKIINDAELTGSAPALSNDFFASCSSTLETITSFSILCLSNIFFLTPLLEANIIFIYFS